MVKIYLCPNYNKFGIKGCRSHEAQDCPDFDERKCTEMALVEPKIIARFVANVIEYFGKEN